MRQVAKAILATALAVLLAVAFVTLGVNLYVQSAGVQERIARGLADAFHLEVKLSGASFTPWGGLHLTGIDVPQPDPANPGSFLQTSEVSARIRLLPLLARRLVIKQLSINDPKVVWYQNAQGSWTLPEPPPPPPSPPPGKASPSPSPFPVVANPVPPGAPGPAVPASAEREPPRVEGPPFTVSVNRFRLKRAAFDFLDAAGKPVASFSGITLDCPDPNADSVKGTVKSKSAVIKGFVRLDEIGAAFTYSQGRLLLSDVSADIAQGRLRGSLDLQTIAPGSPFSMSARFENVQLAPLIPRTRAAAIDASGILDGFLNAAGNSRDQDSIRGQGQIVLRDGHVRYELFQMLGELLRIPELSRLDLSQARVGYHFAKSKTQVDQLLLQSQDLRMTAHGGVGFDGRLDLAAQLAINSRVSDRLPSIIRENFVNDNSGYSHRDFSIRGAIWSPKTDLVQRDVGRKIKRQLTDLLFNVLGGHKNAPPAPSPAPSASAAP